MDGPSSGSRRGSTSSAAPALLVLALALFPAAASATPAAAARFVVDDRADRPDAAPGDGVCATAAGTCSLRAAVPEASRAAGPARVLVPAGTYQLTVAGTEEDDGATGDLDVTGGHVTIEGRGAERTAIGSRVDRILHVLTEASVTVTGLALRGGTVDGSGGGVLAQGATTLRTVVVAGNHAAGDGGGVVSGPGPLVVDRSTIAANTAGNGGGGLAVGGGARITNSTVSGNRVPELAGTESGGGLRVYGGDVAVSWSTFAGNSASGAGSSIAVSAGTDGRVVLAGTVLAGAGPAPDCAGNVRSAGGNAEVGDSCHLDRPSDRRVADPRLRPLRWDASPTPVHVPFADSPLVDTAPTAGCPAVDQRGVARPRDGDGDGVARCDRGAVER